MLAAFSSGVSGLKAQQTSLDVIANNISNVNTTGYKSQRVSFSDLLSQTISAGTSSTMTTGGTNSVQLGLGVSVGSIDTIMTTGTSQTTGVSTDVSIGGEGFFVVQGGSQGEYQYTRAGNLSTDSAGNLTVDGYEVCGWDTATSVDEDGNYVYDTGTTPTAINIYDGKKTMAADATQAAEFSGSLDSSATVATNATALNVIGDTTDLEFDQTSTITVYDEQGNVSDVTISWKRCAVDSTTNTTSWYWEASSSDATIGTDSSGYVLFNSSGDIVSAVVDSSANTAGYKDSNIDVESAVTADTDYTVTVAQSATGTSYDITLSDGTNSYTQTSTDGSATFTTSSGTVTLSKPTSFAVGTTSFTVFADTDSTPTISVASTVGGTDGTNVTLDFTSLLTTSSTSGSVTGTADGYVSGELESVSISADGTITGTYSNGESQSLAQIALAVFSNASGLEKVGSNLYAESSNSGGATIVSAGSGGSGSLSSGTLEMSNVDLAEQFSNMMITQRAYQANSKVISTADEMMQSLISMKG